MIEFRCHNAISCWEKLMASRKSNVLDAELLSEWIIEIKLLLSVLNAGERKIYCVRRRFFI